MGHQQLTFVRLALALALGFASCGWALTPRDLEKAIAAKVTKVEELAFLREEAARLGVRAWLFGGTAAGFAHYVKNDDGTPRFDYDYTNIYRSTQDLDLVIDGMPAEAEALQRTLEHRYPHVIGSKTAWEVRLLRETWNGKEALLGRPDGNRNFQNQHTDSHSTGLIEVSLPPPGESVVRDVRDWDNANPHFLTDVAEGKLHYYFSPLHATTNRAKEGLNPPIFSAVRFLTKAFQYELRISPEDEAKLKEVLKDFFAPRDLLLPYCRSWLEKNGRKLFQHAVSLEYAWDTLERLGLRKTLAELGNDSEVGSLSWWMEKEPLRSKEVGRGTGLTAADYGIATVAHETKDFLAYESITRSPTCAPNVFVSRNGHAGENAVHGEGFYTRIGRQGARGTGLTIRFEVDPKARAGEDFILQGDYVIFRNKRALTVIAESLSLRPLEYFQMLAGGSGITKDDEGMREKLKRRIRNKVRTLTAEDQAEIAKLVRAELEKSDPNYLLLREVADTGITLPLSPLEYLKLIGRMDARGAAVMAKSAAVLKVEKLDASEEAAILKLVTTAAKHNRFNRVRNLLEAWFTWDVSLQYPEVLIQTLTATGRLAAPERSLFVAKQLAEERWARSPRGPETARHCLSFMDHSSDFIHHVMMQTAWRDTLGKAACSRLLAEAKSIDWMGNHRFK